MSPVKHELAYLAQVAVAEATFNRSSANSENSVEIAAPGAGKALVLLSVVAYYSDQSAQDVDVDYTDRAGDSITITLTTGSSSPPSRQAFPQAEVAGIVTQENKKVTITAPAGGAGVTSDIRVTWATVLESDLRKIYQG